MKKRSGFTLVEILVVVGIIALLAALLFPAFNRAKENSRQVNCMANLQQISLAVSQYRKDEGHYPGTLLDLLGQDARYDDGSTTGNTLGAKAPGYLKSTVDTLTCPDDDTDSDKPRSSYGSLTLSPPGTYPAPYPTAPDATTESSKFVWNYWGYRPDGFAYQSPSEAQAATLPASNATFAAHTPVAATPASSVLMDPTRPYNFPDLTATYCNQLPVNVIRFSMSNRFCPASTIITHCVYHRLPTANKLNSPGELYADPDNSKNARDVVARTEPSTKNSDVTTWKTDSNWQKQVQ